MTIRIGLLYTISMTKQSAVMSMTGYAQSEGQTGPLSWRLEMKSVNGKGFDLRVRMPGGFDALEAQARQLVAQQIKRGSLTLSLNIENNKGQQTARLNRALLDDVLKAAKELGTENIRLEHLLAVRGVIDTESSETAATDELNIALQAGLQTALQKLVETRQQEGQHLLKVLSAHLDEIARLTSAAASESATTPTALRDKLKEQLRDLLDGKTPVSEDRLAQEIALLATRADVQEEISRLEGHVAGVRKLLAEGGAVGRKLDFMCQELNREANTLCSKSTSLTLTNIGVELKVVIEQFREQVQNVE